MVPTMMVSTMPARLTKKDSSTEGQATDRVVFKISRFVGMSPISMPLQTFAGLINCTVLHSSKMVETATIVARSDRVCKGQRGGF